jgi:methionyl-tRNA formyltransferase
VSAKLRIVLFSAYATGTQIVTRWANRHGHEIPLVVTSPPQHSERYGAQFQDVFHALPPDQTVLVTSKMKTRAVPIVNVIEPDLIVSAAFPLRIPPQLTEIPRFGSLNLHPAPLPRGRGPNPIRLFYEGDMTFTGTVHRIVPDFDAGPIMSTKTRMGRSDMTPDDVYATWTDLLDAALEEAAERAVSGFPGNIQDESMATYAAPFTEEECRISWNEPFETIHRKVTALNMTVPQAKSSIDGKEVSVTAIRLLSTNIPPEPPGTLLRVDNESMIIVTKDGIAEVTVNGDAPDRQYQDHSMEARI